MEISRVTVDEVRARMDRGEPLALVDARSAEAWGEAESQIPGSVRVPPDEMAEHLADVPKGRSVVTYCTCPHENSAAHVAQKLEQAGFKDVHALHGGFEAWVEAGQPVEARAGQLASR